MTTVSSGDSGSKNLSVDILDAGRLRICLYGLIFGAIYLTAMMSQTWGWTSASFITALIELSFIAYILVKRDELGQKFMMACLVAGFVELLADWYLIVIDKSLVYMPGGPFVWKSPLYMPFSWTGNLFIFGVIGRWFDKKWNLATAAVITGILGGIIMPYWEYVAKSSGFWYYRDTMMLGPVPYYIIVGEFFIAACLPLAFRLVKRFNNWLASIGMGIIFGLWLFVAYWLGIKIFS